MKQFLAACALVVSCSSANAGIFALPFWDGSGTKYTTDNYAKDIGKDFPGSTPLLLLVVTRSVDEPQFKNQMAVLDQMDAEELQLVYVVGSATSTDKHSYWLDSKDAGALLEGGDRFLLLVIAPGGSVCFSSNVAVPATTIVASNKALQPTFVRCAQSRG